MIKAAIAATATLVVSTQIAAAGSIEDRQLRQYGRIEEGRQNGSITWTEGLRLRAEQKRISEMEEALEEDGGLSRKNRSLLQNLQDEASEHIEQARDNDHYRPSWLPRVGR